MCGCRHRGALEFLGTRGAACLPNEGALPRPSAPGRPPAPLAAPVPRRALVGARLQPRAAPRRSVWVPLAARLPAASAFRPVAERGGPWLAEPKRHAPGAAAARQSATAALNLDDNPLAVGGCGRPLRRGVRSSQLHLQRLQLVFRRSKRAGVERRRCTCFGRRRCGASASYARSRC